jgi:hypothetical protein
MDEKVNFKWTSQGGRDLLHRVGLGAMVHWINRVDISVKRYGVKGTTYARWHRKAGKNFSLHPTFLLFSLLSFLTLFHDASTLLMCLNIRQHGRTLRVSGDQHHPLCYILPVHPPLHANKQ